MLARERRSQRGSILVLTLVAMTALLAVASLSLDASFMFDARNRLSAAADAAAMSAAFEVKRNPSTVTQGTLESFARRASADNGFTHGTNGVSVTVTRPAPGWSSNYVQVTIATSRSTFFARQFGLTTMNLSASAIAGAQSDYSNFVILNKGGRSGAFDITGGSDVIATGSVMVNRGTASAAATVLSVGGTLTAPLGISSGASYDGCCYSPAPTTGVADVADPLINQPIPTCAAPCTTYANPNVSSGTVTLNPGNYSSGLTVTGGTVTLNPGVYAISGGDLEFKNKARVNGTGVTFYIATGRMNFANKDTILNLSAPTTGANAGMLIFQARTNASDAVVSGGATANLTGVIYISNPSSKLTFSGGSSGSVPYTVFVVNEMVVSGGGTYAMNTDFSSLPGGSPILGPPALAE